MKPSDFIGWLFYTFDENLRIFIESGRNCGNLKIKDFPGDFLTAGIVFLPIALQKTKFTAQRRFA